MPQGHSFAKGYSAYHNPGIREFEKYFKRTDRSVILRPSITEEPVAGHYAIIEKILVDLYLEKERASLMDGAEYRRVFKNLVYSQRINNDRTSLLLKGMDSKTAEEIPEG